VTSLASSLIAAAAAIILLLGMNWFSVPFRGIPASAALHVAALIVRWA
jgi:hypothetical protein